MSNEYDTLMDALTGIMADPTSSDLPISSVIDVQAIRKRTGLSQTAFASRIGVPVATLRNWEQGRVKPDPAARSLLLIVARNPSAALAALAA